MRFHIGNDPLDIGLNALDTVEKSKGGRGVTSELSVSGFARAIGKSEAMMRQVIKAAEVFTILRTQVRGFDASERTKHLYEIHSAPATTWQLLANLLQSNDPLDIGLNALDTVEKGKNNSPLSLSSFASRIGKSLTIVSQDAQAARVYREVSSQLETFISSGRIQHLVAIHAAPATTWPLLANLLQSNDPLDIGLNALDTTDKGRHGSELSLSGFAARIGKSSSFVTQVTQAAEVHAEIFTRVKTFDASGKHRHLYEIHAAPSPSWPLLANLLQSNDWSVKETKAAVDRVKAVDVARPSCPDSNTSVNLPTASLCCNATQTRA